MRIKSLFIVCLIFLQSAIANSDDQGGISVVQHGETNIEGSYLIRYDFFRRNENGGNTLFDSVDEVGAMQHTENWNAQPYARKIYQNFIGIENIHKPRYSIAAFRTFSSGSNDLTFHGLLYGLYQMRSSQGEIWSRDNLVITKSHIGYDLSQLTTISYDIAWLDGGPVPDFIEVSAFGKRDLVTAKGIWRFDDGSTRETIMPVMESESFLGTSVVEGFNEVPVFDLLESSFNDLSAQDVCRLLLKQQAYQSAFFSSFKKRSLTVELTISQQVKQTQDWQLAYGAAGVLLRPIFIGRFQSSSLKRRDDYFARIYLSNSPYNLIWAFSHLLSLLKEGRLESSFSFKLRDVLFSRLRNSDETAMKEIISHLIRVLNRFQSTTLSQQIEDQIRMAENDIDFNRNLIEKLNELQQLLTQREGVHSYAAIEDIQFVLREYVESARANDQAVQQLIDALEFLMELSQSNTRDDILGYVNELQSQVSNRPDVTSMLENLRTDLSAGEEHNSRDSLSTLLERLRGLRLQEENVFKNIGTLINELEHFDSDTMSGNVIGESVGQMRKDFQNATKQILDEKRRLEVERGIIYTDGAIFESRTPWENID